MCSEAKRFKLKWESEEECVNVPKFIKGKMLI